VRGRADEARRVVAAAVQDLVAKRLGRGFVPLGVLFVIGVVQRLVARGGGAMPGSLVPLVFGLYVLAWLGLRRMALGEGLSAIGVGISFAAMGTWVMRSWMKVVEVERLAQVMTMDLER
jgi:hypothetical protein